MARCFRTGIPSVLVYLPFHNVVDYRFLLCSLQQSRCKICLLVLDRLPCVGKQIGPLCFGRYCRGIRKVLESLFFLLSNCLEMPSFGAFCPTRREHLFSSYRLHFLQNTAKRSKSLPSVVVKS